jgi:hypothetical protein
MVTQLGIPNCHGVQKHRPGLVPGISRFVHFVYTISRLVDVAQCVPRAKGCYAHYISAPLDPDLLFGDSEIGKYMRIRQELAPPSLRRAIPSMGSAGALKPTTATASGSGSVSRVAPTTPVEASSSSEPSTSAQGTKSLNKKRPVLLMAWLQVCLNKILYPTQSNILFQDGSRPIQADVYPRINDYVVLNDFKMYLGELGLERGPLLEAYMKPHGWAQIRWDTPYPIKKARDVILLRVQGVTELEDWEVHTRYVLKK